MRSAFLISALFIGAGCSEAEAPKSQFGRFNQVTLTSWASACAGELAPQRVCTRPAKKTTYERFPWTPQCRSADTDERLHCSGPREWDLWLDTEKDWVMAVCVHGSNEIDALKNASTTFGHVMSREHGDRLMGMAFESKHGRNNFWHDPEVGTISLCWRWEEP